MAVPVEDARVEVSVEAILRAELGPTIRDLIGRLVLDLAREEAEAQLSRLGASLNGGPGKAATIALPDPQSPQGATGAPGRASDPPSAFEPSPRLCRLCQEEKPAEAFERGRWQCRDCRRVAARRHYHERQARARSVVAKGRFTKRPSLRFRTEPLGSGSP